jgi:hypothetical protein
LALSTQYSFLRRTLAQRLNYWGGDIQSNGPGAFTANGTKSTAVDITRAEPDDEWNEAWIAINPGSSDQAGSPTVWRRIAVDGGWVNSTGIFTIQGVWPAPYINGPVAGTSYEVFKVFRPENWIQAINWALTNSYPKRHVPVGFEIPQDYFSRTIRWGDLVKNLAIGNPLAPPVVTEIADGKGAYQPGQYTFAYTLYNDLGETLISPAMALTFTGTNSRAQWDPLPNVPASTRGAHYYGSLQAEDPQLGLLSLGTGQLNPTQVGVVQLGINENGTIPQITFPDPYTGFNAFPPIYNNTNVDVQELHHILQRINPGGYPEIWNDLGSDLYKPLGGKSIMLMFTPIGAYNLKFICSAVVPTMSKELDVTDEPPELIYAGGEGYLWNLLVKTSTIVNTNWQDLAKQSIAKYEELKSDYSLDTPRNIAYRPVIRVQY